jgi:membrane protease YdiL (CAAX protease family)
MRSSRSAFLAIAVVVTGISLYLAFAPARSGSIAFWALAAGPTVALAAVAATWASREGLLREWLSPKWGDFTRGVVGAMVLFAIGWAFARLVAPVGSAREIWLVSLYGQIGDPRALQAHALALAAVVGLVALAEEVLWRGMVTQLLAERVGPRAGWLWAVGLYAVAHTPTMWALRSGAGLDPVLVVAALGGGLLWGAMARAFGRLAPGVLAHALFDWAAIMMFPLWGMR